MIKYINKFLIIELTFGGQYVYIAIIINENIIYGFRLSIYNNKIGILYSDYKNLIIINVLPKRDFEKMNIPGSINIAFVDNRKFISEVEKRVLSKESDIIVHCVTYFLFLYRRLQYRENKRHKLSLFLFLILTKPNLDYPKIWQKI